jgi:hypothetical protein
MSGYMFCGSVFESKEYFGELEINFDGKAHPMGSSVDPGDVLTLVGIVITIATLH